MLFIGLKKKKKIIIIRENQSEINVDLKKKVMKRHGSYTVTRRET